ncbi:helix-turn-helix domain-containing protein [Spirosoma areae]
MTRDELVSSRGYWIARIQLDLFNQIENYMTEHQLSRTQLAEKLGVTKGYVSQILNGDFDHKISKLVDLALAVGKVPQIEYTDLQEFIVAEKRNENNSPYVFKKIIRGDQIQDLPFSSHQDHELVTA